jgi:F-type H+-transporting ATPase subunit a
LVPFVVPSGILFLGVFIGLIQAAIFTILSITYLAEGLGDDH